MTEPLHVLIDRTRIIGDARVPIVPALIAAAGGRASLSGILCSEHPQPTHAPCLQQRHRRLHGLVRGQRGAIDHGGVAAACRCLGRGADARACGTGREAAACSTAPCVRLAGDRPGDADEPGRIGAWGVACGEGGKAPVLEPAEARALIDAIEITTPVGLRDRALTGLMVLSFACIGAALGIKAEDVFAQSRRLWVRLRKKGGKAHAKACHHNLETYLSAYIDGAGIAEYPKGPRFRTIGRGTGLLTRTPLP